MRCRDYFCEDLWRCVFINVALYPQKLQKMLKLSLLMSLFTFLPLCVVTWQQLQFLYSSWWNLLMWDQNASYGLSIMGITNGIFGVGKDVKLLLEIVGGVTLLLPLLSLKLYSNFKFRSLYMCLIFCFIILFNHKSESPTFIVATLGVGLWFFMLSNKSKYDLFAVVLYFILATLSPTDIFPRAIRDVYIVPYSLKALPLVFIYPKILFDIFTLKHCKSTFEERKIL